MDPATLAILIGIASSVGTWALITVAQRSPEVMNFIKRYFVGLKFLVVGAKRVGKTSFYNYLRYDKYADTFPVNQTEDESEEMSFDVDKGGNLKLQIRSAFDIPGEWYPINQVDRVRERKPNVLIVFTAVDSTEPEWLKDFLICLRDALIYDNGFSEKMKSLVIVLNKIDLIKKPNDLDKRIKVIENLVQETLGPIMSDNIRLVKIIPCTLLKEDKQSELAASRIVLTVIEALNLNKRLVIK